MEGTIASWLVKEGDTVEKGDPIVELETDKVNVEVHSDYTGVITEIIRQEGDDVNVGDIIAKLDENQLTSMEKTADNAQEVKQEAIELKPEVKDTVQKIENQKTEEEKITKHEAEPLTTVAPPSIRKKARELGVDVSELQSPPHINIEQKSEKTIEKKSDTTSVVEDSFDKPVEVVKMSRRRMTIAKRLVEAQHTAAMLTTFNEVDMSAVMKLRKERKDSFVEKHGVKLGFMSFFTKAVVGALKEFPHLNAEIQENNIILKKYYDIGIAVSTDEGLVVPIVRDADKLTFSGIEKAIGELGEKARSNQLAIEDLQGGSFTITNGGIFGSLLSTPILNSPQVGILGMHNIQKRAVVMPDDSIEVRPMMYIALSYDHRIVDGKEAVQFLVRIKQMIEDPYDLLLEG